MVLGTDGFLARGDSRSMIAFVSHDGALLLMLFAVVAEPAKMFIKQKPLGCFPWANNEGTAVETAAAACTIR
jgi:hypothetical protein